MIKPLQRKLIEDARARLALSPAAFSAAMAKFGGAKTVETLSAAGYDQLMDAFTALGFRDRRRPINTLHTCRIMDAIAAELGWTQAQFTTVMHGDGIRDFRDVDGRTLLTFVVDLERYGFPAARFHAWRRQVTPAQVRLIQVARKQLAIPDTRYLPMLQQLGGVNTATDLDRRGFDLCMAWMEVEGFDRRRLPAGEADLGSRQGFASDAQLRLIRTLWKEWSGGESEAALNTWLERYHHVSTLRFLTAPTAAKAISALKAMKRRVAHPEPVSA